MCVIILVEDQKCLPDAEILKKCQEDSGEGVGIGYYKDTVPHFKKGMKSGDEAMKFIAQEKIQVPYILHFRKATVSATMEYLTHPFRISTEGYNDLEGAAPEGLLFHNGTFFQWKKYALQMALARGLDVPQTPWNDSLIMAWILAHTGLNTLEMMFAEENNNESRIVTMDKEGFSFLGRWSQHKGMLFSQMRWNDPPKVYTPVVQGTVVTPVQSCMPGSATQASVTKPIMIDGWEKLNEDQKTHRLANISANSASRPLATQNKCLINMIGKSTYPFKGDKCGMCNATQDHVMCCKEESVQNDLNEADFCNEPSCFSLKAKGEQFCKKCAASKTVVMG